LANAHACTTDDGYAAEWGVQPDLPSPSNQPLPTTQVFLAASLDPGQPQSNEPSPPQSTAVAAAAVAEEPQPQFSEGSGRGMGRGWRMSERDFRAGLGAQNVMGGSEQTGCGSGDARPACSAGVAGKGHGAARGRTAATATNPATQRPLGHSEFLHTCPHVLESPFVWLKTFLHCIELLLSAVSVCCMVHRQYTAKVKN